MLRIRTQKNGFKQRRKISKMLDKAIGKRKEMTDYLGWNDYKQQMDTLELHWWQQDTRNRSIRNLAKSAL